MVTTLGLQLLFLILCASQERAIVSLTHLTIPPILTLRQVESLPYSKLETLQPMLPNQVIYYVQHAVRVNTTSDLQASQHLTIFLLIVVMLSLRDKMLLPLDMKLVLLAVMLMILLPLHTFRQMLKV